MNLQCLINLLVFLIISFPFSQNSSASESVENLKFNLPRDLWKYHKAELASGTFIRIDVKKLMDIDLDLKIMTNQKKALFKIKDGIINLNNNQICKFDFPPSHRSKRYLICGYGSCYQKESSRAFEVFNDIDLQYDLFNTSEPEKVCAMDFEIFKNKSATGQEFLNIRVLDSEISNDIKLSGSNKLILEGKACIKHPGLCEIVNINSSNYENAISELKNVVRNKSSEKLNYLIANALPCIEKNDSKCVEKFVLKQAESNQDGSYRLKEENKIDTKFLKEFKQCLSYESLLPYTERLKSGDGKICIFSSIENFSDGIKYKIHSITYPEAFSFELGDTSVDKY